MTPRSPASDTICITSSASDTIMSKECAICYDKVECATILPCRCNVSYCASCWDRSLVQSLLAVGRPQCPTCRCYVYVNVDDDCNLVFAKMDDEEGDDPDESGDEDIGDRVERLCIRLRLRTCQKQKSILEQFGKCIESGNLRSLAENPSEWLRELPVHELKTCMTLMSVSIPEFKSVNTYSLDKADLVSYLSWQVAEGTLVSYFASRLCWVSRGRLQQSAPKCVCGCDLEPVHCCELLREAAVNEVQNPSVACDICKQLIDLTDPSETTIWSCKKRRQTVMHPTGWDICEHCFVTHVSGGAAKPLPVPRAFLSDDIRDDVSDSSFSSREVPLNIPDGEVSDEDSTSSSFGIDEDSDWQVTLRRSRLNSEEVSFERPDGEAGDEDSASGFVEISDWRLSYY
eukprot:gnl/MRDRNA2_/MRDRNA2_281499_c0_seq1.p1 gnl/MRDRNA2_/MRDRNA2_281499_c0~~gnl/MRDRNA2_/MRDRNA2_281499_c0_seq1.p1  ORF type:complete len:416 (+),score=44.92 gnl/MRDRNA2_/MRDRNA2_281499_c0_seq1:47-1249(+)